MTKINCWGSDLPVEVSKGGTGVSSTTAYAVQCGGTTATAPLQSIASVGTADQVLTSNGAGALPTFQDAGGGGGAWEYIGSETAANDAYIEFTGLSSSYRAYKVFIENSLPATDNTILGSQVGITGPTYRTGSYRYAVRTDASSYVGTGGTMYMTDDNANEKQGNASLEFYWGEVLFIQPASASIYTSSSGVAGYVNADGQSMVCMFSGLYYGAAEAHTAVKMVYNTGNISVGTFYLYGIT